jgi:two-component system sensor histidine kinase TctE
MPDAAASAPSIRRSLLLFLIPSLLGLVLCAGALTYYVALRVATSAYDRSLLDPALDMAQNVRMGADGPRLDMLMQAQEALMYDHADAMVFQIRTADGRVIAGSTDLPTPPSLNIGEPTFYDRVWDSQPVRIAAVRSANGIDVQVGETLHKRQRLIYEILAAEMVPTLLIRGELLERGPADLHPLTESGVPIEIAPAIRAFNNLLGQIRESNAVQQRFLGNAAHQLRTPLAGLQMHLELLLRRIQDADVRPEIERMHVATLRASHLASQLLVLARAEAGASAGHDSRIFDLRHVADEAVQQWVPRAIALNIDLGFVLDHAHVVGSPALMSQLLDNLIDNALRYTPSGGSVTVRSGLDEGIAFLCVEDSGPGIPEAARERVFERFYRIEGTPGDGAGLGLAIVKEVAERHGGVLEVQSAAGPGTRIVARFPAVEAKLAETASG